VLLVLFAAGLDVTSTAWDRGAAGRVLEVTPLLLGALIGFAGTRRWPGRAVEVGLFALLAGAVLAAGR
jgi:hypothetical protein